MSRTRRHHNTSGYRATKRGKRERETRALAHRLGVPFATRGNFEEAKRIREKKARNARLTNGDE